jgi:hypothetical protein
MRNVETPGATPRFAKSVPSVVPPVENNVLPVVSQPWKVMESKEALRAENEPPMP